MAMDDKIWSSVFCMYFRDTGEHGESASGKCPGCGRAL